MIECISGSNDYDMADMKFIFRGVWHSPVIIVLQTRRKAWQSQREVKNVPDCSVRRIKGGD